MQNQEHKTALLIMDLQNGIVQHLGDNLEEALVPYEKAIKAAREHSIPVIFVRVGFSKGYPEISPNNKAFSAISNYGAMTVNDEATQIHKLVQPEGNEPVVTKYRVSAFAGSNLEMILRAQQIDTLVLSGISTSGVVLSTLREAADKDFKINVLADACFDRDQEVHKVLMEKIFPRQADVLTVDTWIDTLN
ncbi:cysteine hydrolase family protein [Heyndrickxia ginsengihumi]|uniref:cysteine hydrolase family protein n=1 Tax=Heyndrickxia ginsengihumi TaxID=363870 RepID=UPI0004702E16|nr:isochorismatase family cysteine hydrolase [Heyndrickxia ginsengihumi]MCM3023944.1 cysteine hydrolase [Heyndrickxia ginsengihumi]